MFTEEFTCKRGENRIRGTIFRPTEEILPLAIVCHGFMGNRQGDFNYSRAIAACGYAVFTFDFCGGCAVGESDGAFHDMSVLTEVEDLLAVIDYAQKQPFVKAGTLNLVGCSQGGFVCALTAARLKDKVNKLLLIYPALCIPDDARRGEMCMFRFDPKNIPEKIDGGMPFMLGRIYVTDVQDMDPFAEITAYKGSVTILHGTADGLVNFRYAQRAYEAYTAAGADCTLIPIEGGEHGFKGMHEQRALALTQEYFRREDYTMSKPTLVIMAAGMGSRFGGCKQITPVDAEGHAIIDYSIYDAIQAGFGKVVCIIKPEMREDFHNAIGKRIEKHVELAYAYQTNDKLPEGLTVPKGRTKPWGTGHAILCAMDEIEGSFSAINADDFYGRSSFEAAANFLMQGGPENEHAMVAYRVENTLTENGSVSRGVCTSEDGLLTGIVERTQIVKREGGAAFIEGDTETFLPAGTPVSMNMWAFKHSLLDELSARFPAWFKENLTVNPLKGEYFLPLIPNALITEGKGTVRMLTTDERWFGMTYREDLENVRAAIAAMKEKGLYPEYLWD